MVEYEVVPSNINIIAFSYAAAAMGYAVQVCDASNDPQ